MSHSVNHWSNEQTILEFVDGVLIPYVNTTRGSLSLPTEVKVIAVFNVFAAHRCASFLDKLHAANFKTCFIPAECTGLLQPLDIL